MSGSFSSDGNNIPKTEDTLPQPMSSDSTEGAEPRTCNFPGQNT